MRRLILVLTALILAGASAASAQHYLAEAPANAHFNRTWQRTDLPVASGQVSRTWMWAPEAFTNLLLESYAESPGGQREVQYFDKARMEISDPGADQSSVWYVTNGLLVVEMTTGRLQLGDATFEVRTPAQVNVAGDADDPAGPTYATFGIVLDAAPATVGADLTQRIDRDGEVSDDPALLTHGVTAAVVDELTNHAIAAPFWDFMNSSGIVVQDGLYITAPLFENPYFATGRPISEAYWANVKVGGQYQDVLMQCFERRCLTYTPDNPEGWQIEAGNVGQHYYQWRYDNTGGPGGPSATAPAPGENCDSSYPTLCLPPPPPDLNCEDIDATDFPVSAPDPHGLDGDNDGIGCESNGDDAPRPTATATATATPTPTATPTEAPANVEVSASVSNSRPTQYSTVTVTGSFKVNGQGVAGVPMETTWNYKTTTSHCSGVTGINGRASCSRSIGPATKGYRVVISVRFTYEGKTYRTSTSFTPQ